MTVPYPLYIIAEAPGRTAEAEALAAQWNAILLPELTGPLDGPCIALRDDGSELRSGLQPDRGGVRPEFDEARVRRTTRADPLIRALGRSVHTVVDATAGWGIDAFTLARAGYRVRAIERHPVLFFLLNEAWSRFPQRDQFDLCFLHADARTWLAHASDPPDAVLIDPMFPPKRRASALAKKPMQLLRQLAGEDADARDLLVAARSVARERVVVKRSDDGPPLTEPPSFSIATKLVRFDVYRPG